MKIMTKVNSFFRQLHIEDTDTPDSLADKIHNLEYEHFPG